FLLFSFQTFDPTIPRREPMGRKPAEQRASDRVPVGAPATIRWGEEELSGFMELVNLAGGYVAAPRTPDLGDYVDLTFTLPGDPEERENPLMPEPEMLRHEGRVGATSVLPSEQMNVERSELSSGGFASAPARLPGEDLDPIPHPPGAQKGNGENPKRRPQRPVLA